MKFNNFFILDKFFNILFKKVFIAKFKLLYCCNNSFCKFLISGTAISAAAVGVAALISATKSIKVKSVSCPIAEIIGFLESNTFLTTFSSLNGRKSSAPPPPLAIIIISAFECLLK